MPVHPSTIGGNVFKYNRYTQSQKFISLVLTIRF